MNSYCSMIIPIYKMWQKSVAALHDSSSTNLPLKIKEAVVAKGVLLSALLTELKERSIGKKPLSLIDYMTISALEEKGLTIVDGTQADIGSHHLVDSLWVRMLSEVNNTRLELLPPMCRKLTFYSEKDVRIADFPEQLDYLNILGSSARSQQVFKLDLFGKTNVTQLQLANLDLINAQEPLPSVKRLTLRRMDLSGIDLGKVFPNLESIDMEYITIDQEALFSIGKQVKTLFIKEVDLNWVNDLSFVPEGCQYLTVTYCKLTEWPIAHSSQLPKGLLGLSLSGNRIKSFSLLGLPKDLEILRLNDNLIRTLDLRGQTKVVPNLRELRLSGDYLDRLEVNDEEIEVPTLDVDGNLTQGVRNQLIRVHNQLISRGQNPNWTY